MNLHCVFQLGYSESLLSINTFIFCIRALVEIDSVNINLACVVFNIPVEQLLVLHVSVGYAMDDGMSLRSGVIQIKGRCLQQAKLHH
jgi:hypothetical protein